MKVRVKDWGKMYTTYYNWFKIYDCEEYLEQYRQENKLIRNFEHCGSVYTPVDDKGRTIDTNNIVYEVIREGQHENTYSDLCLIQEPKTNKIYLFDSDALEVIK